MFNVVIIAKHVLNNSGFSVLPSLIKQL